jgi:hypothetical protein
MEPTPPFEEAIDAFKKFLAREGWSQLIVWRRPDDVVRRIGKDAVVRRRSPRDAHGWARHYYDAGLGQGLGVSLHAECEIDGGVCATIFWTADDQEAEHRMMPTQGLKMSTALHRTRGRSVTWLGWWLAKTRLEVFHKALAAEGARNRSRNP